MSRLQSAARDCAIALLSVKSGEHPIYQRENRDGQDDYAASEAATVSRDDGAGWAQSALHHEHPRLVRARLALYLRLLRRVEAWERARDRDEACHARDVEWERQHGSMHCPHGDDGPDDWAVPPMYQDPLTYLGDEGFHEALRAWIASPPNHRPWSPLWLSAPAFEPGITPAMRRKKT